MGIETTLLRLNRLKKYEVSLKQTKQYGYGPFGANGVSFSTIYPLLQQIILVEFQFYSDDVGRFDLF